MKRVQGFVVGYDKVANELLWTVKVKDSDSVHNDQKFLVASLHPGTMITRPGMDVTFRVQPFGTEQEQVLRAVDVSLGRIFPEEKQIMERIPESLNIAVGVLHGHRVCAWDTEDDSPEEAQAWIERMGGDEVVAGLIKITPELIVEYGGGVNDADAVAGLVTMQHMMYLDPIRDTVYAIVVEAFKLGRKSTETVQN